MSKSHRESHGDGRGRRRTGGREVTKHRDALVQNPIGTSEGVGGATPGLRIRQDFRMSDFHFEHIEISCRKCTSIY